MFFFHFSWLFFSISFWFISFFCSSYVSQMINTFHFNKQPLLTSLYSGGWTSLHGRWENQRQAASPFPQMRVSRGTHGSACHSSHQVGCSQSQLVLYGSRQSRWLRGVVPCFSKCTVGNIAQPGPQDLAVEWRQTGNLPVTINVITVVSRPTWNLSSLRPIPVTMSHMKISLLSFYVLKHSITM